MPAIQATFYAQIIIEIDRNNENFHKVYNLIHMLGPTAPLAQDEPTPLISPLA